MGAEIQLPCGGGEGLKAAVRGGWVRGKGVYFCCQKRGFGYIIIFAFWVRWSYVSGESEVSPSADIGRIRVRRLCLTI